MESLVRACRRAGQGAARQCEGLPMTQDDKKAAPVLQHQDGRAETGPDFHTPGRISTKLRDSLWHISP